MSSHKVTASEDEDSGITMLDVLEEEKELEDDASAVLGGSDDQNCTYSQGYLKRQALYSCLTCSSDPLAGICLACSYNCHEGHELVELYTKRNFRCDCGNQKFLNNPCKLCPVKDPQNIDNCYNQNFKGFYCSCNRPYPDPDDDVSDEMIQCIVCEDWFHGRHIGTPVPAEHEYGELTCITCMKTHPFLSNYLNLSATSPKLGELESNLSGSKSEESEANPASLTSISDKEVLNECKMKVCDIVETAVFWSQDWRSHLCQCPGCMAMYKAQHVSYLVDPEDAVHHYEEQGKAKCAARGRGMSQYDLGLQALDSLNRTQKVEALTEYNNLKDELKEYLKKFAENKKVVREEDIKEFFEDLKARKRQRVSAPPPFCK